MNAKMLATVDLGSNSFRLLVGKINEDMVIQPIDQIKATVRLAEGLDESNYLSYDCQLKALEVLLRFAERLNGFSKNQVRVVATSALRIAVNANEFISIASKALGFPIEIISGVEEARLVYIGAIHSLAYNPTELRLVIDIGGGSTEFILGQAYTPHVLESVTMGCVSYMLRYFKAGVLSRDNFTHAIFAARSKIVTMEHLFSGKNWSLVVGTSGTAKSIYEMIITNQLDDEISLSAMLKLQEMLIKAGQVEKIKISGLKEERKSIIAAGLAIMIAIFQELELTSMTIADGALREGVMYDLLGRKTNSDLREATVNNLKKLYKLDIIQGERVASLASFIQYKFLALEKINLDQLKLFNWACQLYEIGLSISHNDYHKHGAYILQNSDLAGFSRPEQTIIAELIKAHRGSVDKVYLRAQKVHNRKIKTKLIYSLIAFRLAVIFYRSRQEMDFSKIIEISLVDKREFNFKINAKFMSANQLTLFSIKEELLGWQNYGYKINLIKVA